MGKKILLARFFLSFSLISLVSGLYSQVPAEEESTASVIPDRIMLSIPGNPGNERAVRWRTSNNVKHSIGQITEASASPFFEEKIQTIEGTSTFWTEGDSTALGHQVIFSKLKPETIFTYRVGDGNNWSEFFYAGDWIFGTMPSLSTAGNHEYITKSADEPRSFSKQWNQIFVYSDNHPENLKGRTYYIDYQGVRIIAVDSNAMISNDEHEKNTIIWLEKILTENPNQWTILFRHFPVYSCSQGRVR